MNNLFIEQRFLKELITIFKNTVPNCRILAYGSRINNTAHAGSDLDLALIGDGDIANLKIALQESNIPFLLDIVKFENLPDSFKKEIEKNYIEIKF